MESASDKNVNLKLVKKWTLEPALFLLFFGWWLSIAIVPNQILKQTCLYTFEFGEFVCSHLDDRNASHTVEEIIQPYVANILMTTTIIQSVVPTVMCLFLGPWSDRYGRKKVMIFIFIGSLMSVTWLLIVSYIAENIAVVSPWNYMCAQLPYMMFGGLPTVVITILCYITDQTTAKNRSTRLTTVEVIIFGSVLIAMASSSFILEWTNASTLFLISFVCISVGTLIVAFFVEESIHVKEDVTIMEQFKNLFTVDVLKELLVTCTRPRQFKQRRILWLLIFVLVLTNFTTHGAQTVFYLFTRQKFGWNLQDMTLYESGTMLMMVVGSITGIILLKKRMGLSDLSMSTISLISLFIDALIKTVANSSWQLYLASAIALFKLISGPMLRSIMSVIVSKAEVSKIYSFTTSIETVAGLASAPLYTAVYSATFTTFPSAFNLITAVAFALAVILTFLISRWLIPISSKTIETKL